MSNMAFICKIPYTSDIGKIRKYIENASTIHAIFSESGVAFAATTRGDECYYLAIIHACDIYKLHVNKEMWPDGGIVRVMSAASLVSFIEGKEANCDMKISVDKDGTVLSLSILPHGGKVEVRGTKIPLVEPDMMYELPRMTMANCVIPVNVFKKLCSTLAKTSRDIRIDSQTDGLRLYAGESNPYTYGEFEESEPFTTRHLKSTIFSQATKVNVGNSKQANAAIYVDSDNPVMVRIRLGQLEFRLYSQVWLKD